MTDNNEDQKEVRWLAEAVADKAAELADARTRVKVLERDLAIAKRNLTDYVDGMMKKAKESTQ